MAEPNLPQDSITGTNEPPNDKNDTFIPPAKLNQTGGSFNFGPSVIGTAPSSDFEFGPPVLADGESTVPDAFNFSTANNFNTTPTDGVDIIGAAEQLSGTTEPSQEFGPPSIDTTSPDFNFGPPVLGQGAAGGSNVGDINNPYLGDFGDLAGGSAPPGVSNTTSPSAKPSNADSSTDPVNYKVRLVSALPGPLKREVIFRATPDFSESRSVDYTSIVPLHMPGGIEVYKSTNSRTFSITAKLFSRTPVEAKYNMIDLQTLRSWTMPFFGYNSSNITNDSRLSNLKKQQSLPGGTKTEQDLNRINNERAVERVRGLSRKQQSIGQNVFQTTGGIDLLGAPPEVLYLYAYSSERTRSPDEQDGNSGIRSLYPNINRVPVVITNLLINYPSDVEYIPTYDGLNGDPFPVMMSVTIELKETHSPAEFSQRFSLLDYKLGTLRNF